MEQKSRNKKIGIIFIIFFILILSIFFYLKMIKNNKIGKNISSQEIVENFLKTNSYKANITVQINSNKNSNKYILKQEYNTDNGITQEVIEPKNIEGTQIKIKNSNLIIENTKLNLSNIYNNYNNLENNKLDLINFINNCKENNNKIIQENNDEIIIKIKNKENNNETLYINKQNFNPTKLIIEDNNKSEIINIKYNEIELN